LKQTPVTHLHVDQILNVDKLTAKQFALAFLDILEVHQPADLNVSLVQSAYKMRLVLTLNAETLVLELVVLGRGVMLSITIQFVLVILV
jgi:hypothetical protein